MKPHSVWRDGVECVLKGSLSSSSKGAGKDNGNRQYYNAEMEVEVK